MWVVLAIDVVSSDQSQPVVVALISALGGVFVAALGALVNVARRESKDPPPTAGVPTHGERIAVLERRADDNDEQRDVQDHHIDSIERYLDRYHGDWR